MEGELEFTEFELLSFEDPLEFERYLLELDDEHDLTNVDTMIYYYSKKVLDLNAFISILNKFKKQKKI